MNIANIFERYSSSLEINRFLLKTEAADVDVSKLTGGTSLFSSFLQILGLLVLFIIIVIASYFASKWLGGLTTSQMKDSNVKIIETYKIAPTKYIQIISVAGKYFAIAVCKDNITLMGELDADKILLKDDIAKYNSFKDVLDEFKKNKKHDSDDKI